MMIEVTRPTILGREDLPTHPSQLSCGDCGLAWGDHPSVGLAGHGFSRPGLPRGYVFVDELKAADRFAFLVGHTVGPARTIHRIDPCVADHLVRVESAADGFEPATHWLRTTTIVRLLG